MGYYSYKLDHDFGLAPNPFGGYCTLAVCKADIRMNKRLMIGDWIFGLGSVKLKNLNHLIYAMKVEEKITFNEYWEDQRFQYKKPVLNGSLVQIYGDNIYHIDPITKKWHQENSAHSLIDGKTNDSHTVADTKGEFVLISKSFYYFGDEAFEIPEKFLPICNEGRNVKSVSIPEPIADEFVKWLSEKYDQGIMGDPINWKNHK